MRLYYINTVLKIVILMLSSKAKTNNKMNNINTEDWHSLLLMKDRRC